MPSELYIPDYTLRSYLRTPPTLQPEDSLRRFAQLSRREHYLAMPVQQEGIFCGMIYYEDVLAILNSHSAEAIESKLQNPVSSVMRDPRITLQPDTPFESIGPLFAESRLDILPVVDYNNYLLGVIIASDLLIPELSVTRPQRIGGMATPFGVYLTDGVHQAGVGNGALVVSGMMLGLLYWVSIIILAGILWLLQHFTHIPLASLSPLSDEVSNSPLSGIASLGISLLSTLLFLSLMRATSLAGYHAAEHQTVHAMEREENLVIDVVRRMPRPHPRCGTNLTAAAFVFFTMRQLLLYVPGIGAHNSINPEIEILAALATLFTFRPLGTFLQSRFTTKPASDRQLASGIAAGEMLTQRFLHSPPARVTIWRRIWCMGILQVSAGMVPLTLLPFLLDWVLTRFHIRF